MAATVTVLAKAFGDGRIVFLSKLLGCSWNEAFIRMIRLWSVCAELQTDKPEVRHIRACLEDIHGDKHLVESGLGDLVADPSLVVVRVRGCDETDWYYAKIEQQGCIEAGKARAATAVRDVRGRFLDPGGDRSSDRPASSDLCFGSSSSHSGASDPQTITEAEREVLAAPMPAVTFGPAQGNAEKRAKIVNDAWNYAALVHTQIKCDGIDANARNSWSGTNIGEPRKLLVAIVDDLTQGDAPNWKAAREAITNRIDVAAAEARRDKTLRWFTPMRMWDAKSFARCAELSPDQVAQPRKGPAPAEPVRRMKTL